MIIKIDRDPSSIYHIYLIRIFIAKETLIALASNIRKHLNRYPSGHQDPLWWPLPDSELIDD